MLNNERRRMTLDMGKIVVLRNVGPTRMGRGQEALGAGGRVVKRIVRPDAVVGLPVSLGQHLRSVGLTGVKA